MTNIIPELNLWIQKILKQSPLERSKKFHKPSKINEEWKDDTSILSHLFNYTVSDLETSIFYKITSIDSISDKYLKKRLQIYRDVNIYSCDTSNFSVPMDIQFDQTSNIYDATSIIIDSTSSKDPFEIIGNSELVSSLFSNIFNITKEEFFFIYLMGMVKNGLRIEIPDISISSLTSNLSKLIFIYLRIIQEDDYSLYNSTNLISDNEDRLDIKSFEKWLSDQIYRRKKIKKSVLNENKKTIQELEIKDEFHKLELEQIQNKYIILDSTNIYSTQEVFVAFNDQVLQPEEDFFIFQEDDESIKLRWSDNISDFLEVGTVIYILYPRK